MGWCRALIVTAAIFAAIGPAEAGRMGGRSSGGGFHGFHSRPLRFHLHQRDLIVAFPNATFGSARLEGWGGGAYSAGVADFDSDQNNDFAAEDMHFRVQDSFGPGDIGRPPPPPEPYAGGPWDAARLDPWHGYDDDGR